MLVDSTGIKVLGDSKWQVCKHGVQGRRQWRKVNSRENSPLDCFLIRKRSLGTTVSLA